MSLEPWKRWLATPEGRALADESATFSVFLVAGCGLALGCLAALTFVAAFPFPVVGPPASGVVGLVTVNGYPKSREPFYFAVITLLLLTTPLVCGASWIVTSGALARRRGLELTAALRRDAATYLWAPIGLGLALLSGAHALRFLALTVLAISIVKVGLLVELRAASRSPALDTLVHALLGHQQRLASSTVALAGCAIGLFLPLALPTTTANVLSSLWWLWPPAFLAAWLLSTRVLVRRTGGSFEAAAQRAAIAYLPAFFMLFAPFLLDSRRAREGLLAFTLVALAALQTTLLRGVGRANSDAHVRACLRACRLGALVLLALAWRWEPDLAGILVLPGDGDHLIAFLNDGLLGKTVYRDFSYPYGPLFYLLDLVSAKLSGIDRYYFPSWFATTALAVLFLAGSARRIFLTWPGRVLACFFLFFAWPPQPVQFRVWAGVFTVVFAVAAASAQRVWGLRLAGVLGAGAFLFSHEVALAAFVGLQPAVLWACRRSTVAHTLKAYLRAVVHFLTGLAAVLLPLGLWSAQAGLLIPYLQSTFGFVQVMDESFGLPMPSLWRDLPPEAGFSPRGLYSLARLVFLTPLFRSFYLPVLLYVIAILYVAGRTLRARRALPQDAQLIGLAGLGLVLFRVVLGRSEPAHAVFGTIPALVLAVALSERAVLRALRLAREAPLAVVSQRERWWELVALTTGVAFLAFAVGIPAATRDLRAAVHKLAHYQWQRHEPREVPGWQPVLSPAGARFYFRVPVAATVQATVDYLRAHTRPDEGVFAFPYAFRYNVLLGRRNPTSFDYLWGPAARPVDQRRVVRELIERAPRYIVYDESEWPDLDGVPTGDRFAELADFIFANYDVEQQIGSSWVLRRRETGAPQPPSVVDVGRPEDRGFLLRGWYYPETMERVVRWASTTASVRLTRRSEQHEAFVECQVYVPAGRPPRWLRLSLDGRELGRVELSTVEGTRTLRFPLPATTEAFATVVVRLDVDRYPADADLRRLGLVVKRMGLE